MPLPKVYFPIEEDYEPDFVMNVIWVAKEVLKRADMSQMPLQINSFGYSAAFKEKDVISFELNLVLGERKAYLMVTFLPDGYHVFWEGGLPTFESEQDLSYVGKNPPQNKDIQVEIILKAIKERLEWEACQSETNAVTAILCEQKAATILV